jgi:GT2 family glycosyltransferase
MTRVHLAIPTHTPRHLDLCLASLALQSAPPASVTLSTDGDVPAITVLVEALWPRVAAAIAARGLAPPAFVYTRRAHTGAARLNQVRNNALRAADAAGVLRDDDLVVILDGDTALAPGAIEAHEHSRAAGFGVVLPWRVNLTEAFTATLTPERVMTDPALFLEPLAAAHDELHTRQSRLERQSRFRGYPLLSKPHKPKLLGGHHAVRVGLLREVDGFDERFVGYGYDDDDLARRLYRSRPRARIAVRVIDAPAFHCWHPTRATPRPTEASGYATFRMPWGVRSVVGWSASPDQPARVTTLIPWAAGGR